MKKLFEPHSKKYQITSYHNQNQNYYYQVYICLHNLSSFFINKIYSYHHCTTNNCGKKISINNVPFNHFFTSLANANEIVKENKAITNDIINVNKKSLKLLGRTNKGEITPAENQATVILPNISEILSN
jgi:hypothetical protein